LSRPAISVKTKVNVAIKQAMLGGIICPLCKSYLWASDPRILEHMNPRELSKDDSTENLRWVHKACADLKTRGCTGTSKKGSVAQGDTHRIAKAARIAAGGKKVRNPMKNSGRKIPAHVNPWGKR
jgi:sulfate adenylyltransferase subunit 1 (EFTu-like GTPase family)